MFIENVIFGISDKNIKQSTLQHTFPNTTYPLHMRRISSFIPNICTRSCRHHWKPTWLRPARGHLWLYIYGT